MFHGKKENKDVVPGWKLCRSCYDAVKKTENDNNKVNYDSNNEEFCDLQEEINREAKKEKLNESLRLIGISPVKTHGLAKSAKINVGCGKLEQSILKVVTMTKGDATLQRCFQNCIIPKDLKHLRCYDMDC